MDHTRGLHGREAGAVGAVGSVAHETVEGGPDGAEDLRWGPEGRLLESHVGVLGFFGCGDVSECVEKGGVWIDEYVRRMEKPTAVPRAMGSRIEAAGLAKTAEGSVREGI